MGLPLRCLRFAVCLQPNRGRADRRHAALDGRRAARCAAATRLPRIRRLDGRASPGSGETQDRPAQIAPRLSSLAHPRFRLILRTLSVDDPARCCDLIKDARQSLLNVLRLEPAGPMHSRADGGIPMTMISIASMHSTAAARADLHSPKAIAVFCCAGLVVSFCLMSLGVDLSAGSV